MKNISVLLFICLMNWVVGVNAFEQTLTFSEAELQQRLNDAMPLERQTLLANIVLTDAKLELLEKNDQLAITAFLDVTALGNIHGSGSVTVQGSLRYEASEGAFYLDNGQLTQMTIDQLSDDVVANIKPLVQDLVTKSIQSKPIYQLQNDDMRQALLKASLKHLQVKNKSLLVVLGF